MRLPQLLERLTSSESVSVGDFHTDVPRSGVYAFSENRSYLYVGRSDRIRARIGDHYSGEPRKAAFALKIARHETGREASYKRQGSIAQLMTEPAFRTAFDRARVRIRAMEVRFVEIRDPVDQALFEIYASEELSTPFNHWKNS